MATAAIPPAFVAELIDDVGAYAGIAAIVGLAVLSLLYFTQAREVKRLREWAGRAPDRDAELAARVRSEAIRQRTSGAPAAPGGRRPADNGWQAARPVQPPGVPAVPATPPGAPAGGGQQAVGPAGRPQQAGQASSAGSPQQPGNPPAAQPPRPAPHPGQSSPAAQPGQHPAESSTGQRPGQGTRPDQPPTAVPSPATAAARSPSPEAALRRTDASSRSVPPRGPRPKAPPPPPVAGDGEGRGGRTIGLIVAGGLVALAVGVLLITQVFGGDDAQQAASPSNSATPAQAPPEDEGPPPRGEVNVAVLNGTTINGLAETVADELEESGFQRGQTATNTADQTLSSTTVQFAEGSRESALEVAEVLGLGEGAVEQLERNTRVATNEEAAVVVLVGNDGVGNPGGAGGGTEGTGATDGTGGTGGATDGTGGTGGATDGTGGATDGTGGAVTP
ncbi:MAG: LytR C-terminal domain-containing protein [Solirubrobacteraceae bacterium MAG38_C4-C5]|nr:LytR C-terminal domain-containing protein [Candidatus Siliceabacter maunaloa]